MADRREPTPTPDVVDLLCRLVAIDSVNPALVRGGAGEQAIAEFVAAWARRAGLAVTVVEHLPGRTSVLVSSRPVGATVTGGCTLLLCGHLDTVGVADVTEPFTARIEGDRLYGRGAYDMKAGLAAALVACRNHARSGAPGQVIVAAVADEEHASLGIRELLDQLDADAAIVTEPTESVVAVAHKGFVWSEIDIVGESAHGSRPELGHNAVLGAGPVLVALRALDRRLAGTVDALLGTASIHPTVIAGGTEASTIPGRCRITVERRTLPGETLAIVEQELQDVLDGCRDAHPGLHTSARTVVARDPLATDATTTIAVDLADRATATLGRTVEVAGVSYWADSAFIAAAGIPTVLFGPGGDGAHASTEWVSVAETVSCAQVLTATAARFCARPPRAASPSIEAADGVTPRR